MFQLRGLGEDCAANPNDPVCRAFYGTPDVPTVSEPFKLIQATSVGSKLPTPPNPLVQQPTPGTNVIVAMIKPWWMSWWAIGLAAVAGLGLWHYSRPRKPSSITAPATVPAGGTAGLFGVPMNENGLTYYRWLKAAAVKGCGNTSHYAAWKRGEDPSGWRAGR